MAWYNSGNWEGIPVSSLGVLLAQLCVAVNERQDYIGKSTTSFTVASGSKSFPTAADFSGMKLSLAITTLKEIQLQAQGIIYNGSYPNLRWFEDGVLLSSWSSVLGSGGYGASWITPSYISDVRPYLQLKEYLSKYTKIASYLYRYNTEPLRRKYEGDKFYISPTPNKAGVEHVWDNYRGKSYVESATSGTYAEASWAIWSSYSNYWCEHLASRPGLYRTDNPSGRSYAEIGSYLSLVYSHTGSVGTDYTGGCGFTVNGIDFNIPSFSGAGGDSYDFIVGSWSDNTNIDLFMTGKIDPSDIPIAAYSGGTVAIVQATAVMHELEGYSLYNSTRKEWDISSNLTYG